MRSPVADKPDLPEGICLVVVEREVTNLGRALAPLHAVDMEIHTHHTQNVTAHDPQRATGIFAGAQILLDRQSVLYAWGPTSTTYTSVESRRLGMATPPSPSGARGNVQTYSTKMVTSSASTGRSRVDACPPATFTNAPDAEAKPTERANVLELRKSKALTPYHADAWEAHLHAADLDGKYPQLVFQLRYSFQAGILKILNTFSPPNDRSLHVYTQAYNEIIAKEFASGRYVGPFSQQEVESIIRPFQSSPLSLVAKPGKPGKFRAVHNFSFPHHPLPQQLINFDIESSHFPCTWGTFRTVAYTIWNLPPSSQASIRDVAEAYRTVPIHPDQWPGLVVRLREENSFAINSNNNFGLTLAGGVYGEISDASCDIFRYYGIRPISK